MAAAPVAPPALCLTQITSWGALAPFAGTALAGPLGGHPHLFLALACLSAAAATLALATTPEPDK